MTDLVRDAQIDSTGRYRYSLFRRWGSGERVVLWVMLNPSIADAAIDDPTIRRCIGFSSYWGYDALSVVNLFPLRATNPKELRLARGAARGGPENDEAIRDEAVYAKLIVAAWGAHGGLWDRDVEVRKLLRAAGHTVHHMGLTQGGQPRHPLYLRADVRPELWVEL